MGVWEVRTAGRACWPCDGFSPTARQPSESRRPGLRHVEGEGRDRPHASPCGLGLSESRGLGRVGHPGEAARGRLPQRLAGPCSGRALLRRLKAAFEGGVWAGRERIGACLAGGHGRAQAGRTGGHGRAQLVGVVRWSGRWASATVPMPNRSGRWASAGRGWGGWWCGTPPCWATASTGSSGPPSPPCRSRPALAHEAVPHDGAGSCLVQKLRRLEKRRPRRREGAGASRPAASLLPSWSNSHQTCPRERSRRRVRAVTRSCPGGHAGRGPVPASPCGVTRMWPALTRVP